MGRVVSGSGWVMSGCQVENHGPRPTRHTCGLGRVGFGRVSVFNYNFRVELGWVGLFFEFE
jgi:hypothetical protein